MKQRLRAERKQQGKTQQQIADHANISLKSYQRIEFGKQKPSASTAILIADTLGIKSYKQFKELFGEETEVKKDGGI